MTARLMSSTAYAARKALVMQGMQAAISTRIFCKQDLKSPVCIYGMCESHGVTVRFNNINMEGMYDREPKPRIHLSALRPLRRRAFTCAHELGHHVFGHGSTIDELRDDQSLGDSEQPNEILANSFAGFVLMPTLGLKEAFKNRGLDANSSSAADIFSIACQFGVGYSTLVNHLTYSAELITPARRLALKVITPRTIRKQLLEGNYSEPLVVADQHWSSTTMDVEEGNLILLPLGVVADTKVLMPESDLAAGRLFRAVRPGITRVVVPRSPWATFIRIAKREYMGLAKYRHLEDSSDE